MPQTGSSTTAPVPRSPDKPRREAVSVKRAAELLDVSEKTVRRLIDRYEAGESGGLEAVRIGKKLLRIPLDAIRQLRAQRLKTR